MNTIKKTGVGFHHLRCDRYHLYRDGNGGAHLLYPAWLSGRMVYREIYNYTYHFNLAGLSAGARLCIAHLSSHPAVDGGNLGTYRLNPFRPQQRNC